MDGTSSGSVETPAGATRSARSAPSISEGSRTSREGRLARRRWEAKAAAREVELEFDDYSWKLNDASR